MVAIPTAQAQQGPVSLSAKAEKIRHRVTALSLGSPITVIMKNKAEYHGSLGAVRDAEFVVNEMDENRPLTVRYEDVNKLRNGYGGYNSVSGRHVNPFRSKVAAAVVLGGIVALVLVLVSLDKS
jgi:small nuclear ribonucleoprotein (snRNP)-like protein